MGLEKARLSGRECSRRRPAGDRCSLCRTGEDGNVNMVGMLSRHPTGGRAQPGGSYDFRREIDTCGSDGGTSPVVD